MQYKNIRKKTYILVFTVFLSILNPSISQGMDSDLSEEADKPHTTILNQSKLTEEKVVYEEKDDSLIVLAERNALDNHSDEKTSLINQPHSISNSYLLAFQDDSEENSKFSTLKYVISLVGGIGPIIPQIAIALKVGEYYDSPVLGYCLIGATILSIEGITSWMICEIIDDARKLIKASKQYQINSKICNIKCTKEVGIGVLSLTLGALSSAPDVYKTYKYNTIKEFAIISFVYDTIPRTIGFYKAFSSLDTLKLKLKKTCKGESDAERRSTEFIDRSKAYFLEQCERNGTTNVCEALTSYETPKEVYSYLSSEIEQNDVEEIPPYYYAKGIPRKISEYFALIFPIASAGFNMVLAYKGYSLFVDDPVALSFLSAFSVLPTFALSSYVIKQAAGNLFDKIYLCRSKMPSFDYFALSHPKINGAFISTSFLLAAATSVSGFYIIADNLENTFLSPVKYVFAALAVGTDLTFGTYTIYSTMVNFGEVIKKKYNKGASYILNSLKKLSDVRDYIINSGEDMINSFIGEIYPDLDLA